MKRKTWRADVGGWLSNGGFEWGVVVYMVWYIVWSGRGWGDWLLRLRKSALTLSHELVWRVARFFHRLNVMDNWMDRTVTSIPIS